MKLVVIELPITLDKTQKIGNQHTIGKSLQRPKKYDTDQKSDTGSKSSEDTTDEESARIVATLKIGARGRHYNLKANAQ